MNENMSIEQQPTTHTPEASGDTGEKLFTQADLDRIIGERLSRAKARTEPSPEDAREADLKARETRLACREYISAEGFPEALLELFSTDDAEKFKAAVKRLDEIVQLPSPHRKVPRIITGGLGGGNGTPLDRTAVLIEEAFKPPKI